MGHCAGGTPTLQGLQQGHLKRSPGFLFPTVGDSKPGARDGDMKYLGGGGEAGRRTLWRVRELLSQTPRSLNPNGPLPGSGNFGKLIGNRGVHSSHL